ncbi:MAG TPA: methyltransferase domain-containing protein [Candidatus Binataceae bacterium]|nr:methyltransferase domain-containing protein [Candidatus Binataceae bacterium]
MNHQIERDEICQSMCPACGFQIAAAFFNGGAQPLATLAWPASEDAARSMTRLPVNFVRCVECGHVYNPAFDYAQVPYSDKPNLMFNRGATWSQFIEDTIDSMLREVRDNPTIVEIGHGDGSLIGALAEVRPEGRFVGFDPHGATCTNGNLELRAALFEPEKHLAELRPDLVISRHVLEHLNSPLAFLQRIAFAAARLGREQLAYFEVPCVDRALETGRTVDFYYEHNSQFSTQSFRKMLSRCGATINSVGHGYGGEVIFGFVTLGGQQRRLVVADEARAFCDAADAGLKKIGDQLAELARDSESVVVWGGTGKSAAFINRYSLDRERFPIVVDSDAAKVGTFVPGTGQEIRSRDWMIKHPDAVVIIPPQWRALDIVLEMEAAGIAFKRVLIEHEGALIDYFADAHPYDLGKFAPHRQIADGVPPPHVGDSAKPSTPIWASHENL